VAFRWPARAIVLVVAAGVAFLAAQQPDIRVNVSLVHVIATVRDKAGALVGTMQKDDFEILDNGAKQEVAVFARQTDQPLSVALLVDTSGSTAKELKYEIDSAARFLHALLAEGNPEDRAALYSFSYDIQQGEFTHNYASLERQVRLLHGDTGTSLYDAIYFAGQALERREGRKAMIVVTDGGDTTSTRDLKAALKQAQLADAVIFPIVVLPIVNDAGRNTGGEHALEFMAQGTGGRSFYPEGAAQLDKAFADVVMELRTQYLLAFYPRGVPLNKNPFHSLEVRVKTSGLRVSARNGYYGESEGGGSPSTRISVTPERTTKKR
jgi:Ca-activated chloride channel family protein